ncbi:MAG TPA: hypothetical protein VHG30_05660 [Microvirga sp.]|nr:hypothetical protein [Microvirga sp.]
MTRLWSRNGRNWTDAFPWIVEVVERLPVQGVILNACPCSRTAGPTSKRSNPRRAAKMPA